ETVIVSGGKSTLIQLNFAPSFGGGLYVIGVHLAGCYDITDFNEYSVKAGRFDLSGYTDVTLRFWRWLNTDDPKYVRSEIRCRVGNQVWTIWKHDTRGPLTDTNWVYCVYPINDPSTGLTADDKKDVYIEWVYQVIDGQSLNQIEGPRAWPATGWNIDDIEISGKPK
ncbi:MAG: hypothetical protein QHH07_08970, partial [Sedimentisphaerales bacterium]|nr:hypothetical protein [Sedimentisphaerales bacterium]